MNLTISEEICISLTKLGFVKKAYNKIIDLMKNITSKHLKIKKSILTEE